MAATDALWLPRKGGAWRVYSVIKNSTTGNPITGGLTGLQAKISKDAGSFNNTTASATEIGTTGYFYVDLTTTEMNVTAGILHIEATNSNAIYQSIFFATANLAELAMRADLEANPSLERYLVQNWMALHNKESFDASDGEFTRYAADSTTAVLTAAGTSDPTGSTRGKFS